MIDDSCLLSQPPEVAIHEHEHSRAPSPQKSDEESVIFETQIRSTKCPTGSRKRKTTESCVAEIQILNNMQEAMNKHVADDSLDMYGMPTAQTYRTTTMNFHGNYFVVHQLETDSVG